MALPIKPTPILRGREATQFQKKVKEKLGKPVKRAPRPNMEKAKRIAFGNESTE